jgi:hypothetical protein
MPHATVGGWVGGVVWVRHARSSRERGDDSLQLWVQMKPTARVAQRLHIILAGPQPNGVEKQRRVRQRCHVLLYAAVVVERASRMSHAVQRNARENVMRHTHAELQADPRLNRGLAHPRVVALSVINVLSVFVDICARTSKPNFNECRK